jgi:hypothetical protein
VARSRNLRTWALALWGISLLAAAGAQVAGTRERGGSAGPPAAVGAMSRQEAAVLPARIADELRAAGSAAPLRPLTLAAVVALAVGLPTLLRRQPVAAAGGHRTLRSRRHAITLRAPPLRFA